ncbi:hypothetical protein FOL47_006687 [Perkinsus chesapeaki]|uniref:Uncharacterized protein n=1 Tax=Perkinsus chesapeaki TaxID=330153 RepID=A0A7J6LQY3_PERCH|nr:hypothetical protein FOL47_006687 [Perkinsus chesapeaki]
MPRLFNLFALMVPAVMSEWLQRSTQATPRPTGDYVSDETEAHGLLTFSTSNTFDMDVVILDCPINVQGLKYQVVHVAGATFDVTVNYAGTDLEQKVRSCDNPQILVEDFNRLEFYFDPLEDENDIELKSSTDHG